MPNVYAAIGKCDVPYFEIGLDLKEKFAGKIERNISAVLRCAELASRRQGCRAMVVIKNALELWAVNRGQEAEVVSSVLRTLLSEIEGTSANATRDVLVITVTEHFEDVDPAARRRFHKVNVDPPGDDARLRLFEKFCSPYLTVKPDRMRLWAAACSGWRAREIDWVIGQARRARLRIASRETAEFGRVHLRRREFEIPACCHAR